MSVKRAVYKSPSTSVSAKFLLPKRRYKTGVNTATQFFLGSFENEMFHTSSPSRVSASPYMSLSFDDFDDDMPKFPLTEDDTHLCMMNFVCDGKTCSSATDRNHLVIPALKGRRVHFASELEEVHFVACPSAISRRRLWYQQTDYKSFKEDVRGTIMALYRAQGCLHQLDMKKFTVSGLEKSLSLQQVLARKRNGTVHVQAVLLQQTYYNDPMRIRQISELFTKSSMQRARFRGMLDSELLGTFDKGELGIDCFDAR
jgi:hypothetical protein